MPHDHFSETLSAYLDGELEPREREEVEALLRQRPELAEALEQARQLGDEIRQLPSHTLGGRFTERVLAAAQRQAGAVSLAPPDNRRRVWLAAAAGVAATVAALALALVFLRPDRESEAPHAPPLSAAEQRIAALLAQADQGEAVVLHLRLTKEEIRGKVLDRALAAHGISAAPATASNPAAAETAQSYKALAQAQPRTGAAADVLFIEADAGKLRRALADVAARREGTAISWAGAVPSIEPGVGPSAKAEGEGGSSGKTPQVDRENYAQHLPPRGFPLLKSQAVSEPHAPPAASGRKTARALVVIEVAP